MVRATGKKYINKSYIQFGDWLLREEGKRRMVLGRKKKKKKWDEGRNESLDKQRGVVRA